VKTEVAIVGNGVAGYACATRLARHGIRSLLIGRGLPVDRPPLRQLDEDEAHERDHDRGGPAVQHGRADDEDRGERDAAGRDPLDLHRDRERLREGGADHEDGDAAELLGAERPGLEGHDGGGEDVQPCQRDRQEDRQDAPAGLRKAFTQPGERSPRGSGLDPS